MTMTAVPSGVNETLSERCFRPFASKTRELSGLSGCLLEESAQPLGYQHLFSLPAAAGSAR